LFAPAGMGSLATGRMTMPYVEKVSNNAFDSLLELPTSGDPNHNAMLTIILRYRLVFADGRNRAPGVIVEREGTPRARDSKGFAHSIRDWDDKARAEFTQAIWRAEKIWNLKFLLFPPLDYSEFDFPHPHPGWYVRPNVMCLFRMEPWGSPHIKITAVRVTSPVEFVSFTRPAPPRDMVIDDLAPWRPTLGHELGHVLGMQHIKALTGDAACIADQNVPRCYGETKHELANIMGGGQTLWPLNAEPWLDRIALHTGTSKARWQATLDMKAAPRIGGTGHSLMDI
jgi:hypothetical protein